jgi:hypothetical protein
VYLTWIVEDGLMTLFPCLIRSSTRAGGTRFALGDPLVDRYLEFVAGRARPNTVRAVAFDLKAFFAVVAKEPVRVTPADVFEFMANQRGDRSVVRLADRESGAVGPNDRAPALECATHLGSLRSRRRREIHGDASLFLVPRK